MGFVLSERTIGKEALMLVLSRRIQEKVLFPTIPAVVQVIAVKSGVVRLGIEAPPQVPVLREEVQRRAAEDQASRTQPREHADLPQLREFRHLLRNRLNVTRIGLALARRQVQAGCPEDVALTLAKIEQDCELLQQRVEEAGQESLLPSEAQPVGSRRALVVEDDDNERELLAGLLRMVGLDVDTAGDGATALDYLHTHKRPDVVLLDMVLPRCDGPTTVREIRHDPAYADLPIFAVTGHTPDQFQLDSGPAGVNRWFRKPITPELLLRELNREFQGTAG
jgi:two-component system, OmpR family, response regulator